MANLGQSLAFQMFHRFHVFHKKGMKRGDVGPPKHKSRPLVEAIFGAPAHDNRPFWVH